MSTIEQEIRCPDCGGEMWLSKKKRGGKRRNVLLCERFPFCKGNHGADEDGKPLGTPADAKTRIARQQAHRALTRIEKMLGSRDNAYRWLRTVLKLSVDECHIASFDIAACNRLIGAVNTYTRGNK